VKKDISEAITWYKLGAERGDSFAASNLAWIFAKGPKKLRDPKQSAQYAAQAVAFDAFAQNKDAAAVLAAQPTALKKEVIKGLVAEIGAANVETAETLDETVVVLSRKAWQLRNPRQDLF
jgi:hypothetical protein